MKRPRLAIFAASILTIAAAAAHVDLVPAAQVSGTDRTTLFLGFEEGEERRYVLGPPEELYPDERGEWSIWLRELVGDPPEGIFELTHHWSRGSDEYDPPLGTVTETTSKGELRVNRYGFPLDLEFDTKRQLAAFGEEAYTVRFRLEDDRFVKSAAMGTEAREVWISIPNHSGPDPSQPAGLFTLDPTALDCSVPLPPSLRQAATVPVSPPTAGTNRSPAAPTLPLRMVDNAYCRESLFAHPGLLSMMLPELWERATGEHEFLLFRPTGPFGMEGMTFGGQAGGIIATSRSDTDRGMSPQGNFSTRTLRYLERVEVQVGPRTREAWLFDELGAFKAIYVDDDNVVVRIDIVEGGKQQLGVIGLSGAVANFDPTQRRARDLYIRLLFPSEY